MSLVGEIHGSRNQEIKIGMVQVTCFPIIPSDLLREVLLTIPKTLGSTGLQGEWQKSH